MAALPTPSSPATAALFVRLQAFNLLPSHTLHPLRTAAWFPEAATLGPLAGHPAAQRSLHQRWSQHLLDRLGDDARPVADLMHPALPLALAAPALLQRLVRDAGVLLLGRQLRQAIVREQVLAAREGLGSEALHWVRTDAAGLHPGLEDTSLWLQGHGAADYALAADHLGAGLLAQAWQDAPAPLRRRADWKLSPDADATPVRAASRLDATHARSLCLQLLVRLDMPWLSSFPATR